MDINTVCTLLIDALKGAGYNDSTIFSYQGAVRRFKAFCEKHNVTEYDHEIGRFYAEAVVSPKTGKFSKERYHLQGRFIRLIDSYIRSDSYISKAFREHMERCKYSEVVLAGLDECGCVGATAKGVAKTGIKVKMLEECIGSRFPKKKVKK